MPKRDGLAVLEELRKRPSPPTVIIVTAHGDVEKAVRAIKLGAYDFIAKPFEGEHVEVVVARALKRHALRGDLNADVRIIAATNRDLAKAIAEGRFREDLYYRLKVITIELPPLRERRDDIPLPAHSLVEKHASRAGRKTPEISKAVIDALASGRWPGNVRELLNVMERCVLLGGDPIEIGDLPDEMLAATGPAATTDQISDVLGLSYVDAVAASRRLIVVGALKRCGGHQTRAAESLGVSQPYLSRLMKNLGIGRTDGSG